MGEDNVSSASGNSAQSSQEERDSSSVCTVIFNPADVTFIPILPEEASEEVVLYEDMQGEVKLEIDVCSDGQQEVYTEMHAQQPSRNKTKHRNTRQGLHICKVCSKSFTQVVNLTTHERIHTGEKPFECTVCLKHFSQQPNLWKHMRTHTGERPYQCNTCKKSFTQQANLTKHIRIHTGERPFACQYCGKRFTQQANLTKHVRLHTGERPFHCRFCTKTFVQQSNLERHERTHTGLKPYSCNICFDSFAQNAHLSKHIRTIHKNVCYVKVTNEHKEKELSVHSEVEKADINSVDQYEGNTSKKYGIPVLYCTKTGRILKRID